VKVVSPS